MNATAGLFICSGVPYQQSVLSIFFFAVLNTLSTWLFSVISQWKFNYVDSSLSQSREERNIGGVSRREHIRNGRRLIEIYFYLERSQESPRILLVGMN